MLPLALIFSVLAGCASHAPAPTAEGAPVTIEKGPRTVPSATAAPAAAVPIDGPSYTVKKGDTLYSIALDHGHDYKDVAAWNNLENPNRINAGQQLRMSAPRTGTADDGVVIKPIAGPAAVEVKPVTAGTPVVTRPVVSGEANTEMLKREPKGGKVAYSEAALARAKETSTAPPVAPAVTAPAAAPAAPVVPVAVAPAAPSSAEPAIDWSWPTSGKVSAPFAEGSTKGIVIAGTTGEPVFAAAPGRVVYAGSGLRGYGKLVVVRHSADFLSVYAHNNQILVKEGDSIARRQKIAEVGSTDAETPRLHFEIRRQGKPVDPLKFLPPR